MKINKKLIDKNFSSRHGSKIKFIVVHDTGNDKPLANAEAHFNYFNNDVRNASAHYFVDEKQVLQIIEDSNSAWHVGDGKGKYGITNINSIGIEICINDGDYVTEINKTVELIEHLMKKHGIPKENVVRHYDASRKICPAKLSHNNWAKWHELYNKIGKTPQVESKVAINLNGKLIEIDGHFIDNINYVSVRGLCEAIGYKVGWKNGVVTLEK